MEVTNKYLCSVVQIHFTRSARSISEVMKERVAEEWHQWTRLVEVEWNKVWREVYVGHIGDNFVDHIDELGSDFFAFQ